MLIKHCLDASWGQFLNILEWVAQKRDVFFVQVDKNETSQGRYLKLGQPN